MKTEKKQSNKFIAAARKAECNESEAAFEGKLCRIAKAGQRGAHNKTSKTPDKG